MSDARAVERVRREVDRIRQSSADEEEVDRRIYAELDAQHVLTVALLPINSTLRTFVTGCLLRNDARKKTLKRLKETQQEEDLVPVEVHGGGKCKITILMTREAVERERGR